LNANTIGDGNTALGSGALQNNSVGNDNIAIGLAPMLSNTSGSCSIAIGTNTLRGSTNTSNNTAVGWNSMYFMSSSDNTAVGFESLRGGLIPASNTGGKNVAIGYQALVSSSNGGGNVALGYHSLLSSSAGSYNTAVGHQAGLNITTGTYNTIIGYQAGSLIQGGNFNTIIGHYDGTSALESTVVLADGFQNVYLYATASKVAINKTATPNATLDVNGNTIITGSLTVTGPIRNVVNDGFVSCSFSVTGTTSSRNIVAYFLEVDGTTLTNGRQLIHWWTSTSQFGAASAIGAQTYTITSGSQVVVNATGSINHAVTDSTGSFGLRLSNGGTAPTSTIWFHTEVQGIVYSLSTTVTTGGA
jgi:hypothetical protein